MSESFAELFEESLNQLEMQPGAIVKGSVVHVDSEVVVINVGLKSEGVVSADQFRNEHGDIDVAVGDEVDVALDAFEDGFGETRLSRDKAKRAETWERLTKAQEANETVTGMVTGKVKGGFTVEISNVRAFLPGSLVDIRPVHDSQIENKEIELKIIKMDPKRNNVVVSRRAVIEQESSVEREALLSDLDEGKEVKGVVKNLTDYGAFVDLGGIDGLLHITDMSWKRVKHPSEVVNIGDEIMVKVIKFDREKGRVSLGLKQLGEDPWADITRRYPVNARLFGKVTNLTDYGCFVEIEDGVEGLVHVSEMDWTNKNIHPSKVVQLGDEVEVMVLEIDEKRRRISLGLKQCVANPWLDFSEKHKEGEKISGAIKSITDFGIFIGLAGGIDGLVHLSDISWHEDENVIRSFKKDQEVEALILAIDPERERISLGIKQLEEDPYGQIQKGDVVKGAVKEVDAKGAIIVLEGTDIEGFIKVADISVEKVKEATEAVSIGDVVEAKVVSISRKDKQLQLSVKAKEVQEEKAAIKDYGRKAADSGNTTLGDLLKEQMKQG